MKTALIGRKNVRLILPMPSAKSRCGFEGDWIDIRDGGGGGICKLEAPSTGNGAKFQIRNKN